MGEVKEPPKTWRERKKSVRHRWQRPFAFIEWNCERAAYRLRQWAFIEILERLGHFAIIVALIFYISEAPERKKAKHYQAWQVINAAQGKPGSGGRIDALQDLNKDGVSLIGVDISLAHLQELDLKNAELFYANFSGAYLVDANLSGAHLVDANLSGAKLVGANLSEADITAANLSGAKLLGANLSGAHLLSANLSGARLGGANLSGARLLSANLSGANLVGAIFSGANLSLTNLSGAYLSKANLSGAHLRRANLSGADLTDANLPRADLTSSNLENIKGWKTVRDINLANIWNVKNPPEGFIEWAKENGAVSIEDYNEWKKLLEEKTKE